MFSSDEEEEKEEEQQEGLDPFDPANLPTVEEMLADLPCEEEEYAEALEILAEAYYKAGLDYREKLSDLEEAVNIWQELLERMETSSSRNNGIPTFQNVSPKGNRRELREPILRHL